MRVLHNIIEYRYRYSGKKSTYVFKYNKLKTKVSLQC